MRPQFYILDPEGTPVPALNGSAWAAWFEDGDEQRRVARDECGGGAVSTVFLGLDHGFGAGPPVLFESMVFGGPLNGEMRRYATRAEALAGHAELLVQVQAAAQGGDQP